MINYQNNQDDRDHNEDLPWISEGIAPDKTHDIPSQPPQEIPTHQPQEIPPAPQELTQYHSSENSLYNN